MEPKDMKIGKVYMLDYGGTQVLGRFKGDDTTQYLFYEYLHYWAGFEAIHHGDNLWCEKSGIESIREASPAEKHALLKFAIEHNTI